MTPVSTLSQASAGVAQATAKPPSKANVSGDFQTFLTLLTAQLRNQDPLKPVESTQFVAQLASFSAVEQQVQSNTKLQGIMDALSSGSTGGLSQWIGKEVRNAGSAPFANKPLDVLYKSHTGADRVDLIVYNANNDIVAHQNVSKDATHAQWTGVLDNGTHATAGALYRFETNSILNGKVVDNSPAQVFSKVQEVRKISGKPVLFFADGSQMKAADVAAMRAPQA